MIIEARDRRFRGKPVKLETWYAAFPDPEVACANIRAAANKDLRNTVKIASQLSLAWVTALQL